MTGVIRAYINVWIIGGNEYRTDISMVNNKSSSLPFNSCHRREYPCFKGIINIAWLPYDTDINIENFTKVQTD